MPVGVGLGVAGAYGANRANKSAKEAANASKQAAGMQADAQQQALDYLKEINALPQELREKALQGLGDYFQVPGAPKDQQTLISEAMGSPLYAAIMGTQKAGEGAILRHQSATGGLRSGSTQGALTDFGQQTANRALLESFNQAQSSDRYERGVNLAGLSGLAGLTTGAPEIANLTTGIGQTNAAGILGAAQARQQGSQNTMNNLLGIAGLGIQAYGNGMINI